MARRRMVAARPRPKGAQPAYGIVEFSFNSTIECESLLTRFMGRGFESPALPRGARPHRFWPAAWPCLRSRRFLHKRRATPSLPEVRVDANAEAESATSPVIGYRAKNAVTATKTDTPLSETPQAVTVVTRDQIVDQGATNLQDALGYAAGVRSDAYGLDSRTDSRPRSRRLPRRLPRRPAPGLRLLHQHHAHRALHARAPRSAARALGHAVRRGHRRRRRSTW